MSETAKSIAIFVSGGRCGSVVYRRDTYRVSGSGKSGFSLHYDRGQCARKAVRDGLCEQHARIHDKYPNAVTWFARQAKGPDQ